MTSREAPDGGHRDTTARARRVWDHVAAAWDARSDALADHIAPLTHGALDELRAAPGERILDLASGTGVLGREVARRVGDGGHVLCVDLSPAMVAASQRRATEEQLHSVESAVMGAQQLSLPDRSVDAVVCQMGLMLMHDPVQALAECRRVLVPGGRLVASTWGGLDRNAAIVLLALVLVQHGQFPQANPRGTGGVFSLSDPLIVEQRLRSAGLRPTNVDKLSFVQSFSSFDDYWKLYAATGGPHCHRARPTRRGDAAEGARNGRRAGGAVRA